MRVCPGSCFALANDCAAIGYYQPSTEAECFASVRVGISHKIYQQWECTKKADRPDQGKKADLVPCMVSGKSVFWNNCQDEFGLGEPAAAATNGANQVCVSSQPFTLANDCAAICESYYTVDCSVCAGRTPVATAFGAGAQSCVCVSTAPDGAQACVGRRCVQLCCLVCCVCACALESSPLFLALPLIVFLFYFMLCRV